MDLNLIWVEDPTTNRPSVSLTLLMLSFVGCLVGGGLQIAGKIENTSICLELFYGCSALYFGRRITAGGKVYDDAPTSMASQIVTKVTESNNETHS